MLKTFVSAIALLAVVAGTTQAAETGTGNNAKATAVAGAGAASQVATPTSTRHRSSPLRQPTPRRRLSDRRSAWSRSQPAAKGSRSGSRCRRQYGTMIAFAGSMRMLSRAWATTISPKQSFVSATTFVKQHSRSGSRARKTRSGLRRRSRRMWHRRPRPTTSSRPITRPTQRTTGNATLEMMAAMKSIAFAIVFITAIIAYLEIVQ